MVMECRTLQAIGGSILSSGDGGDHDDSDRSINFIAADNRDYLSGK